LVPPSGLISIVTKSVASAPLALEFNEKEANLQVKAIVE
jgi:hypothetical protein